MERSIKYNPDNLCIAIFTLCVSARFAEYFLIETDKTAIGENVLHKAVGIMGVKWGILYRITENIWAGLGEHLFNNTVATNMLHVVSLNGTDELQSVRVMAAQIISFAFVLVIYHYHGNRRKNI